MEANPPASTDQLELFTGFIAELDELQKDFEISPETKEELEKEWYRIQTSKNDEYEQIWPINQELTIWKAVFCGPEGSAYEGGFYLLTITLPRNYPEEPPMVVFDEPVPFHPNVWQTGVVCIALLNNWDVKYRSIKTIVDSITVLFLKPNPKSPANPEAAALYVNDRAKFIEKIKEYIQNQGNN